MSRELLVIFRIWGLIRHACLPTFSYMENVDVVATLFRILTRLLQTPELDDTLLGNLTNYYSTSLFFTPPVKGNVFMFLVQVYI